MIKNRKKAEAYISKLMSDLDPSGYNSEYYSKYFDKLSDKEFHSFMLRLKNTKAIIPLFYQHFSKKGMSVVNALDVAEKRGIKIFQRVYTIDEDGDEFLSTQEFPVIDIPVRRAKQSMLAGIRTPDHSRRVNPITHQVSGKSQSSMVTFSESLLLTNLGLTHNAEELLQTRGGDLGGVNAAEAFIDKYGKVSHKDIEPYMTGTGATASLKAFLKAAHVQMK